MEYVFQRQACDSVLLMSLPPPYSQCSMKNSSIQNLQIDTYMQYVLAALADVPSVSDVEISPEAKWRPAGSGGPFLEAGQAYVASSDAGVAGSATHIKAEVQREGTTT